MRCRVDPRDLGNMYGSIGPLEARKGERLGDIAERVALDPATRDTEFAAKVLAERDHKAVLVYVSFSGNAYAGDGNKRALNACLHGEPWIEAILVPVDETDWTET
jgi:hypothetical protein